jgi:general secretion pathway protein A
MYQAYWGLGESPFRGHRDPRFFYAGPTQDEAYARLSFLVDERRTLGLLLGESGGGKSQLLETFAAQLGIVDRQTALVSVAGVDSREFLWLVATALGIEPSAQPAEWALYRSLADHIVANRYQQWATILLVDDADEARAEVLDTLLRLAEINLARDARLTIVLAAQDERLHRLGNRLLELADLRIDLEGWEADDTAAFVKQSLAVAGRSTPIFSDAALSSLHELTSGIPRRVKQLADLALVAGAGSNLVQIEPNTVEAVYRELGVVTTVRPFDLALRG